MSIFLTGVRLDKRDFMLAAMPCFPFLAWYYIFSHHILRFIMGGYAGTYLVSNVCFNLLISFTLVLSSFFISRANNISAICMWSIFSSTGIIFIVLIPIYLFRLAVYLLLAVVFGIGLLAFFTFFWDLTAQEERGRVAGLVGLFFLPATAFVYSLVGSLDFHRTAILCIILNLAPLAVRLLNPNKIDLLTAENGSKLHHPGKRTILLYLAPWAVFSLINATLARTISLHVSQDLSPSSYFLLMILQNIGGGVGALLGGLVADVWGRRVSLLLGLASYGVSTAISGLAKSYESFCCSHIGIGLTWGTLLTLYLFVIWGDLADPAKCARRYSIGLATFYLAISIGSLFTPELARISLTDASVACCLLIFFSDIPLILAPELLPADFREKMRLKVYICLVKRKRLRHLAN